VTHARRLALAHLWIGFIALFGVAVMNGVIMVANLNRMRDLGIPLFEAVLAGAGERLRPVLMTATVATVGMLPAALATGVGSDVQRSVGTVVAGGLIPATFLTLFILPALYFVIERRVRSRRHAAAAGAAAIVGIVFAAGFAASPLPGPPVSRTQHVHTELLSGPGGGLRTIYSRTFAGRPGFAPARNVCAGANLHAASPRSHKKK